MTIFTSVSQRGAQTATGARTRARPSGYLKPLFSVMGWELRRFLASRLFWIQAAGYLLLTCFVVWATRVGLQFSAPLNPGQPDNGTFSGFVAGTSVWGLLSLIPIYLVLLAVLLPFVNAEGITRDLNRRTHELLMTTALPNWAYIWGRYLVGLLISLGLAVLMLGAILGMGAIFHLTIPNYPLPPTNGVIMLWIGMVLPATVLISSLSFMLGTLFSRQANLVKIALLVVWIILTFVIPSNYDSQHKLPAWYVNWDPTSFATTYTLLGGYNPFNLQPGVQRTVAQWRQLLLTVENKPANLAGWFGPHLLIIALSLLLVVVAMFTFRRFRNTFGA
jgi:ABC-type transport system involved in multi-copper enzyme maturation permease subunit